MPYLTDADEPMSRETPHTLWENDNRTFTVTIEFNKERGGYEVVTANTVAGEYIEYPNITIDGVECPPFAEWIHAVSTAFAIVNAYETGTWLESRKA